MQNKLSYGQNAKTVINRLALKNVTNHLFKRSHSMQLALIDQALVSGSNFFTGILLARFLGIEEFGRFTLLWMIVLLVNLIQMSLILQPMMSLGPKHSEQEMPNYLGAVSLQQIALFIIFSILVLLCGATLNTYFPEWHTKSLLLPTICVVTAFQAQEFIRRYFLTRQRLTAVLLNDFISYGGQTIILIGCFYFTLLKTEGVLWIIALTSTVAAVIGAFQLEPLQWRWAYFKKATVKHWVFARWLLAGSFMQWLGGQFFVMVSAALLSQSAAGAISAARNILGLTMILFAATENIVSVQASIAFKKGGWKNLRKYITKISFYGGAFNGIICLTSALFAPFFVNSIFGHSYSQYTYLVYWFSATHFLMFFIRPLTSLLRTVEHTTPIALSSIFPMLFSLLVSVPFIKVMGLTGAMIVMLSTQVIILVSLFGATAYYQKEQLQ